MSGHLRDDGKWAQVAGISPIGIVAFASLSAGDIATYFTGGLGNSGQRWDGWAICDGANGTPNLADKFLRAKTSGAGGTGGSDSSAHTHSVTSNVAVADHAAHTHSVTSNVAVADHASHTHTYTDVPNHTHPHNIQGNTTASTTGTNVLASTTTGGSARAMAIATSNPTGGVATGTTAGPSATLTHDVTNNAVTSGNPSATLTHGVTNNAVTSGAASATENRPAYYELVPVMRVT